MYTASQFTSLNAILKVWLQPAGLPSDDLCELGLLVLLLGDQGHSVQKGVHLCQSEGAGLAWGHERALLKECLGGLCHISLEETKRQSGSSYLSSPSLVPRPCLKNRKRGLRMVALPCIFCH